jgi:virginiamycin B lyase
VHEFPLALPESAAGIVAGADGNLWCSQLPGRLWRITPTGVLQEFPLPTPDCLPVSIASGGDGTIWLAELGANRIAHVTVQGDVTEFDVEDCRPLAIAAGPDGAAWFVDVDHSRLGRIGPDGKLSFVPRPGGHVPHRGLVCGPDKNLWMVGDAGLVRVNLAARRLRNGSIIELRTEKWPGRLAVGPNNDLWFTERNDPAIGRITSDGTIKRFAIPQPARAIVNGP